MGREIQGNTSTKTLLDRFVALLKEHGMLLHGEKTIGQLHELHREDALRVQQLQDQTSKRNTAQDFLLPMMMEHQRTVYAFLLGFQMLEFSRKKGAYEVYVLKKGYESASPNGNEADLLIDTGSDAHCCPKQFMHWLPLINPHEKMHLRNASGATIASYGTRACPLYLTDTQMFHHLVLIRFCVCDVQGPILSEDALELTGFEFCGSKKKGRYLISPHGHMFPLRPNGKPMLTAKYKIDAEGANRMPLTKTRVCEAVDVDVRQHLVQDLKENLEPRVVKDMIKDLSTDEVPKEAVLAKMRKLQTCIDLLLNTPECRALRPPPPPWGEGAKTLPSTGNGGEGKTVSFQ